MSLPDNPYFVAVKKHADSMLEFGRPLVDEERCPLFAGTIDVGRQEITSGNMVPPPGIRMSDFNFRNDFLMGASNMNIYRAKVSSEYHVDEWADPPSPGFYFSVSGTPQLTRTLLRLALLMEGEDDFLGVDKHSR